VPNIIEHLVGLMSCPVHFSYRCRTLFTNCAYYKFSVLGVQSSVPRAAKYKTVHLPRKEMEKVKVDHPDVDH
jgi:hypothetical protein